DAADFLRIINEVVVLIQQLEDKALVMQIGIDAHHPETCDDLSFFGQPPIGKPRTAEYHGNHIDNSSIISSISLLNLNTFLFNTSSNGVDLTSLPRSPTITRVSPASRRCTAAYPKRLANTLSKLLGDPPR